MATRKNGHDYEISDEFWNKIKPLLPLPKPQKKLGRPRKDNKRIFSGILYLLRTGCQLKALPRFYGAPSTVHDIFQEWRRSGLFEQIWKAGLLEYDNKNGLEWEWQAIYGAMTKAPLGGAGTGANPTDRGKKGTKRSILTVRNTLKYVANKDMKPFAKDLRTIYTAPDEKTAVKRLDEVTKKWEVNYPSAMNHWNDNWDAISPIFKFSSDVRTAFYTTNAIES